MEYVNSLSECVPVDGIDYDRLTMTISHINHEYKRMKHEDFMRIYSETAFGCEGDICEIYKKAYMEYKDNKKKGIDYVYNGKYSKKLIVLNVAVYDMYTCGEKAYFYEEIASAIQEFLKYGILTSTIGEAVPKPVYGNANDPFEIQEVANA